MNFFHDKLDGRFTNFRLQTAKRIDRTLARLQWPVIGGLALVILCSWTINAVKHHEVLTYIAPKAEAAVVPSLSVDELEARLDVIVWGIESDRRIMKEGETFQTFDPPQSWIDNGTVAAKCLKPGGTINLECYSFGPHQIKIPTLKMFWPKLHRGETLTDKEARDMAESNDGSRRFFLDCAEYVRGCADNWSSFLKHKTEGQIYIDLIRQAKGITI